MKQIACFLLRVYGDGSAPGSVAVVDGHLPGAKKGPIMELLILAIVVIVALGLYRYWRTRAVH
jgi:hypothetical protein